MADIGVRLTGDRSDFTNMLAGAEQAAEKFGNSAGKKIFSYGAIATALGSSIGASFDDIAKHIARTVIGFSEEQQESLKKAVELSEQLIVIQQDGYDKRLSAEQKLQGLNSLKGELERRLALNQAQKYEIEYFENSVAVQVKRKNTALENEQIDRDTIALAKIDSQIRDAALAVEEKHTAQSKIQQDINDAELSTSDKLLSLEKRRQEIQSFISEIKNDGAATEKKQAELDAVSLDIAKAKAEIEQQRNKALESAQKVEKEYQDHVTESVKENYRYLELQQKARIGLNDAEAKELKILEQGFKIRQNQAEIDDLFAKKLEGTITPAEQTRLDLLTYQKRVLENQLTVINGIVVATESRATAEVKVAQALTDQQKQLSAINAEKNKGLSGAADLIQGGGTIATYGGQAIQGTRSADQLGQLSDAVLREVISRDQAQIESLKSGTGLGSSALAEAAAGYFTRGLAIAQVQLDSMNASTVLSQRSSLRGMDYDQALASYTGDLSKFDALYSSANQTNDKLDRLSTQLENSGLFPVSGPIAK